MQIQAEKLPEYLREKVVEAQARLRSIEADAQKFLKEIKARGKASRRELDGLLERVQKSELVEKVRSGELASRAQELQKELLGRLDELQRRVLDVAGVATREQVNELSREIGRLAKRVEKIARRNKTPPAA